MPQKHIRLEDALATDIANIAVKKNMSENAVIEQALKFYRDYIFMGEQATIVNQEILKVTEANLKLLEHRINLRTNKVLSEAAIQLGILNQIIAGSLEIDPLLLPTYRKNAVEFLGLNQRVLRLDDLENSEEKIE